MKATALTLQTAHLHHRPYVLKTLLKLFQYWTITMIYIGHYISKPPF